MSHWTEELFKENPELFLGSFNMDSVPGEVDYLLECLEKHDLRLDRLLDLNCGIGRHSVEMGKRGYNLVGTDISPRYIQIAGERAKEAGVSDRLSYRVADMRNIAGELAGESPFDGIICLWTSFGFYDDDTEEDILRQCYRLVKSGGFFALDIVSRDWLLPNLGETSHRPVGDYFVLEDHKLDILKSRMINTWTYLRKDDDGNYQQVKSVVVDHRLWSPHELINLFAKVGFMCDAVYPGFSPYSTPRPVESMRTREFMLNFRLMYIFRKP